MVNIDRKTKIFIINVLSFIDFLEIVRDIGYSNNQGFYTERNYS